MKRFISHAAIFLAQEKNRRNLFSLLRFCLLSLGLALTYALIFQGLMFLEGREYSFASGLYWTLTAMSTVGFGDIVFHSEAGRVFTLLVIFSGILLFMLIMPFIFIRFIYQPWLEASRQSEVPRALPEGLAGHALILGTDDIALHTAELLRQRHIPCFLITERQQEAALLAEQGFAVMLGEVDMEATYVRARAGKAVLVAALLDNLKNTGIAATARGVAPAALLAACATNEHAEDILRLAGCGQVFNFTNMLGRAMGRRVFANGRDINIIASFEDLRIAEARAAGGPLEGKSLRRLDLRAGLGLNVLGIWRGSEFMPAHPDTLIERGMTLLLAGTLDSLNKFRARAGAAGPGLPGGTGGPSGSPGGLPGGSGAERPGGAEGAECPVLVLGGGRVGRAVVEELESRHIPFTLLDKDAGVLRAGDARFIHGNAEDGRCLRGAGMEQARSVIITASNDDLNIYLTLFCRKLRPEIQIVARCNLARNRRALYQAGASLVMAISSLAANSILNILLPGASFLLTEGLNILRLDLPPGLAGKTLRNSGIRQATGCNVAGLRRGGVMLVNLDPDLPLEREDELIIICSPEAEEAFMRKFA